MYCQYHDSVLILDDLLMKRRIKDAEEVRFPHTRRGWHRLCGGQFCSADARDGQWTQENKGVSSLSSFAGTLTATGCRHTWN